MPTTLTQTSDAGLPDAPGHHGTPPVGLAATMTTGYGGAYLSTPLDTPATLHARCYFAPRTATGGTVHLAGGWSADGEARWSITWDGDMRTIALQVPGESPITATLPAALDWHQIEAGLDSAAGSATFRVNGVLVGIVTGAAVGTTARAWLGVLAKPNGAAGQLALDRWVLSGSPVGPHRVEPTHPHAGDPTRWLVVYNADHPDGPAWAEHYRAARGVPYANLCGLPLPLTETIDADGYLALRDAVLGYLTDNGLASQVVGVLLGLGVPGVVDYAGIGDLVPVASLLHTDAAGEAVSVNPLFRDPPGDRPTAGALGGVRFTGRVDGASLAEAAQLIDRATALMDEPPNASDGATVWLDPVPESGGVNPLYTAPASAWAAGDGPGTLRVPVEVAAEGAFASIADDLAFWGWGQPAPPADFFGGGAGRRAVCVQVGAADPGVDSVRDGGAGHWVRRAVDAGYAAAAASSRAYTLAALPQVGVFFEALRRGWTLAEAWCVCQPFVRSGMMLLGDPLLTLAFPRAGFDVFGPASSLEAIDPAAPSLRLPQTATSVALPLELLPGAGQAGHYLVRRVDARGRSDGGSASTYAQPLGEHAVTPPDPPCWPDRAGWRAALGAGVVRAVAVWPVAPRLRGAGRIVLEAELADTSVEALWDAVPAVGQTRFVAEADGPGDAVRMRWRAEGDQGGAAVSAWSAPLIETEAPSSALQLLEVSP